MRALQYTRVCRPPSVNLRVLLPSLRLVAAVSHALARVLPAVRIDVDIDDCITSLSCDLMLSLRAGSRLTASRHAVDLNLILLCRMRRSRGGYYRKTRTCLGQSLLLVVWLGLNMVSITLCDYFVRIVKVLGVLALPLALVCHCRWPEEVLWQWACHIHLGLDFCRFFLHLA